MAKDFPTIKLREMIVDNTCMQLASNPEQFDVMVCPPQQNTCEQTDSGGSLTLTSFMIPETQHSQDGVLVSTTAKLRVAILADALGSV